MFLNQATFANGPLESMPSGWAPAGATAQTFPRNQAGSASSALVSGTLYLRAIQVPISTVFANISVVSIGAESGGTHAWACILDCQRVLRAISADNTGATFFSGSGAVLTFSVGSTYTAPYDGIYYIGLCCSFSTTGPTMAAQSLATGVAAVAPAFCGTSNTGLTTPASAGTVGTTVMNAVSGNGGYNLYAWTT